MEGCTILHGCTVAQLEEFLDVAGRTFCVFNPDHPNSDPHGWVIPEWYVLLLKTVRFQ